MNAKLKKELTLFPATTICIGSVVGSGIFVSTASIARNVGDPLYLFLVWGVAGLMTLFGALTQCELAGQIPKTGGFYKYFYEIYGESLAYFYGWANFIIAGTGAISAIAFIFGSYIVEVFGLPSFAPQLDLWAVNIPILGKLYPLAALNAKLVGAALIITLTEINVKGVKLGTGIQSASVVAKVIALTGLVVIVFIFGRNTGSFSHFISASGVSGMSWSGFILALSGAFWAYDGWGNVAYMAGEVKNSETTVPRAIILGTFVVIALYLLINAAYVFTLPISELGNVSQDRVASAVVSAVSGPLGATLIGCMIILATFDTVNASILSNARVYFAMATEGLFPSAAGRVHPVYHTPSTSLWWQSGWALFLLFSGSFEIITSMYVFVNWALYVLMALGVFVLRRRFPRGPRPFETPGFPWVPLIYLTFAFGFVVITLVADINQFIQGKQAFIQSVTGILLVLTGAPLYFWLKKKNVTN